jgi:ABC-type uncharacterized transport system substrate-binding protein
MNRFLQAFAAVSAGLLIAGGAAQAHPHVWVTMKSAVVYAPDGRAIGVRQSWAFDDMYSAFATQGLEQKTKGEFTTEELKPLAQVNVESLKEYDYFTFAQADGKKALFVDPTDYHLEFNSKDTVLTLHFLLPFKTPVKAKALTLEVFDPEFFVDFQLDKGNPVALSNAPAGCQLSVAKPKGMTPEMVKRLSEIPVDGKIPDGVFVEQFSNKISVKCP